MRKNLLLQRFALKSKPIKTLKALQENAFKVFLVARLIGNCCSINPEMSEIRVANLDHP